MEQVGEGPPARGAGKAAEHPSRFANSKAALASQILLQSSEGIDARCVIGE